MSLLFAVELGLLAAESALGLGDLHALLQSTVGDHVGVAMAQGVGGLEVLEDLPVLLPR
jgi:hypothetical protein